MIRTFDPVAEIQKLRDHLSSNDMPIAMLFGAGTSCAVKATDEEPLIPAVAALTESCAAAAQSLEEPFSTAWKLMWDSLPAERRNVEEILSSVRQKLEAILASDTSAGLNRDQLKTLEAKIKETIATEVIPSEDRFPPTLPHQALGRWLRNVQRETPVEIFSLNYDTLIERGLETEWVPFFDGFVGAHQPFFSPGSLVRADMLPGRRWARLWKMHGSVTWQHLGSPEEGRIIRGPESKSGEMILPSLRKYDESRKQPYVSMLDRLRNVLTERNDIILICAGYSFSDQHINEVVFEALESNPGLHVFALCFDDPPTDGILVRKARTQRKLLVLSQNRAIVGASEGTWKVTDPKHSANRLDGLFDLDKPDEPSGELRLGDFNSFCALLGSIADQSGHG
jgi:hypothetical protein